MSNWLDLVGDDSNVSMKSADFDKCEVRQLSNSRSLFDPELDSSQQGLPLLFKKTKLIDERSNSQLGKRSRSQMNDTDNDGNPNKSHKAHKGHNGMNNTESNDREQGNDFKNELPPKAKQRTNEKGHWRRKKSTMEETPGSAKTGQTDFSHFLMSKGNGNAKEQSKASFAAILNCKRPSKSQNTCMFDNEQGLNSLVSNGNNGNVNGHGNGASTMSSAFASKENSASASILSVGFNGQSLMTPSNSSTPSNYHGKRSTSASKVRSRARLSNRKARQAKLNGSKAKAAEAAASKAASKAAPKEGAKKQGAVQLGGARLTPSGKATGGTYAAMAAGGASASCGMHDSDEEDEDIDVAQEQDPGPPSQDPASKAQQSTEPATAVAKQEGKAAQALEKQALAMNKPHGPPASSLVAFPFPSLSPSVANVPSLTFPAPAVGPGQGSGSLNGNGAVMFGFPTLTNASSTAMETPVKATGGNGNSNATNRSTRATTPLFPLTPSFIGGSPFVFSGLSAPFPNTFAGINAIDVSSLPSNARHSNDKGAKPCTKSDNGQTQEDRDHKPALSKAGKLGKAGPNGKNEIPMATPHNTTSISFSHLGSLSAKKRSSQSPLPHSLLPQLSMFSTPQGSLFDFNNMGPASSIPSMASMPNMANMSGMHTRADNADDKPRMSESETTLSPHRKPTHNQTNHKHDHNGNAGAAPLYAVMPMTIPVPVYVTSPSVSANGAKTNNADDGKKRDDSKPGNNVLNDSISTVPLTTTLINSIAPNALSSQVLSFGSCSTTNVSMASVTSSQPVTASTNGNIDDESGNPNDNPSCPHGSTIEMAFVNDKNVKHVCPSQLELSQTCVDTPAKLLSNKVNGNGNGNGNEKVLRSRLQESREESVDTAEGSETSNFIWGHSKDLDKSKDTANAGSWANKLFSTQLKQIAKEKVHEEAIAVEQRKQEILIEKANLAIMPQKHKHRHNHSNGSSQQPQQSPQTHDFKHGRQFRFNKGFENHNNDYHYSNKQTTSRQDRSHSKKSTPKHKRGTFKKQLTKSSTNNGWVKKGEALSSAVTSDSNVGNSHSNTNSRCGSVASDNRSKSVSVAVPIEVTESAIAWRTKQITFGKNTDGYQNYIKSIPKEQRRKEHPQTPDPKERIGKKRFVGKLHKWRQILHSFDNETAKLNQTVLTSHDGKGKGKENKMDTNNKNNHANCQESKIAFENTPKQQTQSVSVKPINQ